MPRPHVETGDQIPHRQLEGCDPMVKKHDHLHRLSVVGGLSLHRNFPPTAGFLLCLSSCPLNPVGRTAGRLTGNAPHFSLLSILVTILLLIPLVVGETDLVHSLVNKPSFYICQYCSTCIYTKNTCRTLGLI